MNTVKLICRIILFVLSILFLSVSLGLILHLKWFWLIPILGGWAYVTYLSYPNLKGLLNKIIYNKEEQNE